MKKFEIYNTIERKVLIDLFKNLETVNITEASIATLKENVLKLKEQFFNFKITIFDNNLAIIDLTNDKFCIIQWEKIDNYFIIFNKLEILDDSFLLSKITKEKLIKTLNFYKYIEVTEKSINQLLNDINFILIFEKEKCEIKRTDNKIFINYKTTLHFYELIIIDYKLEHKEITKNLIDYKLEHKEITKNLIDNKQLLITNFIENIDLFKNRFEKHFTNETKEIFHIVTLCNTIIDLIEKYDKNKTEIELLIGAIHLLVDNFELFHVLFDYTDIKNKLIIKHGLAALMI